MATKTMDVIHTAGRWVPEEESGSDIGSYPTKEEAIAAGVRRGNGAATSGQAARLTVRLEDGSVAQEFVFGDPDAVEDD